MHQALVIESDSSCDSEVPRKWRRLLERIDSVNSAFEPAAYKHLAIVAERNTGRVRNVTRILGDVATDVDTKQRNRQLFAARSRTRYKQRTVIRVKRRISDRMKIAGQFLSHSQIGRFARLISTPKPDFNSPAFSFGNDHQHAPRTQRYDRRLRVPNRDCTTRGIAGVEAFTVDHNLAGGNRVSRIYIKDFRYPCHKVVHHTASHKKAQNAQSELRVRAGLFVPLCRFVAEFGADHYVIMRPLRGYIHYQRSRQHSGVKTKSVTAH